MATPNPNLTIIESSAQGSEFSRIMDNSDYAILVRDDAEFFMVSMSGYHKPPRLDIRLTKFDITENVFRPTRYGIHMDYTRIGDFITAIQMVQENHKKKHTPDIADTVVYDPSDPFARVKAMARAGAMKKKNQESGGWR